MPASGISSELSAHQMAPAGAIAHSRSHLCPRASTLSFSSLVSPLRPLGVGLLGRCDPRSVFLATTLRTQVRPAIGFVSGKEGLRPRIAIFSSLVFLFTGTSFPRDRLLALPEFRNSPWPLRRSRGDVNGGRCVRSPCPPVTTYVRHFPFAPCAATVQRAPSHNRWGVSETTLPAKTQGRTLDCPFNFPPPRVAGWLLMCRCQVCNRTAVSPVATVRARGRFNTTTLRAGSPWWSSGGSTRDKRERPSQETAGPSLGLEGTNPRTGRRYF